MSTLDPIAYTYEADIHCPACSLERFGAVALADATTEDNEGNLIGAVAPWDEWPDGAWCGDCNEVIVEADAS